MAFIVSLAELNMCVQLPQNPLPHDGVFEAKTLPSACIQNIAGLIWMTHPGWNNYDEDCLNLNVYAPEVTLMCSHKLW